MAASATWRGSQGSFDEIWNMQRKSHSLETGVLQTPEQCLTDPKKRKENKVKSPWIHRHESELMATMESTGVDLLRGSGAPGGRSFKLL